MKSLLTTPLQQVFGETWAGIDPACRKAFFAAVAVSLLAFGFEATNLTLHHDDLNQIFIQSTILGHYLGRFGTGWLHYYTQNAYFMPFLQMAQGIVLMSAYGVLVAHFWGLRKAWEIALVASTMCVFPYMAQVYQYNTTMATYSVGHLMAAAAVVLSTRARLASGVLAILLYAGAFSIYQSVAGNAATILLIWLLSRVMFPADAGPRAAPVSLKTIVWVFGSVAAGGALYLLGVSLMDIKFDDYQAPADAFRLKGAASMAQTIPEILRGTRNFFTWPEPYFPGYVKAPQLLLLGGAAAACGLMPQGIRGKSAAFVLLALACLSPRALQLLHPRGHFHELTLTAYAVLVAGTVMITQRLASVGVRNASSITTIFLLAGYLVQSNWISTVNYLNTVAHYATVTQVLARVRSLPDTKWDGRTIVVVGSYDMGNQHPFQRATGVGSEFVDAQNMERLARLMRDQARFINADQSMPKVLEYAAAHPLWPHPDSVAVVDGMAMVIMSKK